MDHIAETIKDLNRFIKAQDIDYETALAEIKSGHKRSHWIWYIFPQIAGLGFSSTAEFYAIKDRQEAVDYINNDVLRGRLIEISEALLSLESLIEDGVCVVHFNDKWYRDRDEFFQKACIGNERLTAIYDRLEDFEVI